MRPRSWPGAAPDPGPLRGGAAGIATPGPGDYSTLAERLATVEAGIRADRHRQPAAVVEAIARLWSAGATVAATAAEAGVSPHIVRDRLRRAGVLGFTCRDRRRHVREVFEKRGARLIAAYEAGAPIHALAARAGISDSTLTEYLAARGVTLRRVCGVSRGVLEVRGGELIAAYESGRAIKAVAAEAGINAKVFRDYLVEHGVAIRGKGGGARERLEARAPGLIAAYGAGATLEALATGAGVCTATMRRFLASRGVEIRDSHRQAREKLGRRGAELVAAYRDGGSIVALAASAGVAPSTMSAFLVAQGARLRHDRGGGSWRRIRADG